MKTIMTQLIHESLKTLALDTLLDEHELLIHLEHPKNTDHGDFSCNIAMLLARFVKKNPRELATQIIQALPPHDMIDRVVPAGPGFINFFVKQTAQFALIEKILADNDTFGKADLGKGEQIHIEFVSANPTGPLHVGHGRGAAYGAVVANLLEAVGYTVWREYYVNDAGRQMHILGTSVWLRYLEQHGLSFDFPKNAYRGDYILDIAKKLSAQYGDALLVAPDALFRDLPADEGHEGGDKEAHIDALIARAQLLLGERYAQVFEVAKNDILADIQSDLAEFGVQYQSWFSEQSLTDSGALTHSLEKLKSLGCTYQKAGATWFKSTEYGDDKDRVLMRADGRTTYFCSDVAYHVNKIERGFSRVIDVLGADHHGYVPRVHAAMRALGIDDQHFKTPLVQFAILYRAGHRVQMSTRSGSFVTLRELREEVGTDAARFFYIMRKAEQHMDFDLDLAKSRTNENPVYYIQYAHARISSLFTKLAAAGKTFNPTQGLAHLDTLSSPHEIALVKHLARFPETIAQAATQLEPHLVTHYLRELAQGLHTFYNAEKIMVDNEALCQARCCLVFAVQIVLKNGLHLLGISAPDSM